MTPQNPLFTDEYLSKLSKAAERYFSSRVKILFRRTPIDIAEGVSEYNLPENMTDLIDIKYKGKSLIPMNTLSARDRNVISVINKNITGQPTHYFLKEGKYNSFRLFPVPSETLIANPGTIDLATGIAEQCIIHYYILASDADELPPFLRRRLTKYFVMRQAYFKEGPTQDVKAAAYFDSKLEWAMNEVQSFVRDCSGSRYFYVTPFTSKKSKIPRPVLPFEV